MQSTLHYTTLTLEVSTLSLKEELDMWPQHN
jgi:hypothetical protein